MYLDQDTDKFRDSCANRVFHNKQRNLTAERRNCSVSWSDDRRTEERNITNCRNVVCIKPTAHKWLEYGSTEFTNFKKMNQETMGQNMAHQGDSNFSVNAALFLCGLDPFFQ